jgi:hypothetical protein
MAWYGMAWYGMAWYGMARQGKDHSPPRAGGSGVRNSGYSEMACRSPRGERGLKQR